MPGRTRMADFTIDPRGQRALCHGRKLTHQSLADDERAAGHAGKIVGGERQPGTPYAFHVLSVRIKALSILAGACGISRQAAKIARSSFCHKAMNSNHDQPRSGRLFFFILVCLLLGGLGALWLQRAAAEESRLAQMHMRLEFAGEQIVDELSAALRGARLMASDPTLRNAPETLLLRIMRSRSQYDSMVLLDAQGRVRIHVERMNGDVQLRPVHGQLGAGEYHALVEPLLKSGPGAIWFGDFALLAEAGVVRVPFRPVWPVAVTVESGQGVLLFNLGTRSLFERLQARFSGLWIVNRQGGWLEGGDPGNRYYWQFEGVAGQTLQQRDPALAAAWLGQSAGQHVHAGQMRVFRHLDLTALLAERMPELAKAQSASIPALGVSLLAPLPAIPWPRWFWLGLAALALFAAGLIWVVASGSRCKPRAEAEVRERLLQALIDQAPVGILMADAQGLRRYVNDCWCQLAGMSREDALGMGWKKALHPDDRTEVEQAWRTLQVGLQCRRLAYRFLYANGEVRWVQATLLPIQIPGRDRALVGVIQDLSAVKQQEQNLLQSRREVELAHDELDSILQSSPDAIVALDLGFCLTIFNAAYAQMMAQLYDLPVERGLCLLNLLEGVPQDRASQMTLFGQALQGERVQIRHVFGDESRILRTFDLTLSPQCHRDGTLIGAVMLMRDVTAASHIENTLKRREELFRAAIESSLDAIVVLEAVKNKAWEVEDFRIVEANQNALELIGYARQEAIGGLLCELLPVTRSAGLFDKYRRVFETGVPLLEERAIGDRRIKASWLHYQGVAISNGIALTLRDISDRKLAEQKLFDNEARMAAVVANVQDGVITLDWMGTIRSANPVCYSLLGRSYTDLIGQSLSLIFPQLLQGVGENDLLSVCREHLGVDPGVACEVQAKHGDGHAVPLEMTLKQVILARETFYTVTLHDLLERKSRERLMQNHIAELQALQSSLNDTNTRLLLANRELSRLAHLDGLTGLANRRYFDEHYPLEWSRCSREGVMLAVAMVDVDYFKRYNDGYGHQAGDECLKRIAAVLAEHMRRPGDFVARYGGEEFVLVMPNTGIEGAQRVLVEILKAVRDLHIPHAFSDVSNDVTLSAGVAVVAPKIHEVAELLVHQADLALYRAKQTGRNRCEIAPPDADR